MHQKREVYLDNAATTQMDEKVLEAMLPYMRGVYGNPSSSHRLGSEARAAVGGVRRDVIDRLGAEEGSVFFTSGGTEANNWAIMGAVEAHGIDHIITSRIEHKSVLASIDRLVRYRGIQRSYVELSDQGEVMYDTLATLLQKRGRVLVSLMHANNEIGNFTDIHRVGELCRQYGALFHTDMVQTVGHYPINLKKIPLDICTASAHKFFGPKGVGFVYVRPGVKLIPLLYGGMQERGFRGGTENVAAIVGLGKALCLAMDDYKHNLAHVKGLKIYMLQKLREYIPSVVFHGLCNNLDKSLVNLLNIGLRAKGLDNDTLLFKLSIEGISASMGSACMSGASMRSHVIDELNASEENAVLRFSLSKNNTDMDIDYTIKKLSTNV